MITFRLATHSIRDVPIVEVFFNERFLATICPDPGIPALTIISKYLDVANALASDTSPKSVLIPFEA